MSYHITVAWRYKGPRYRLEGDRCPQCGTISFPPRSLCTTCQGERTLDPLAVSLEVDLFQGAVRDVVPAGTVVP